MVPELLEAVGNRRTPIGKFIHSSWGNLNVRCGKYKHLRTENKCRSYESIKIEFTREEYKDWCLANDELILSLSRPSLDRIDPDKNYSLDNIRVIELVDNISRKRTGNTYLNGPRSRTVRGVRQNKHGKYTARITRNGKEQYLGTFLTEDEALNAFSEEYEKTYNKKPW